MVGLIIVKRILYFNTFAGGCDVELVRGMMYNPCTHQWSWTDIQSCNYAIHAVKSDQKQTGEGADPDEEHV